MLFGRVVSTRGPRDLDALYAPRIGIEHGERQVAQLDALARRWYAPGRLDQESTERLGSAVFGSLHRADHLLEVMQRDARVGLEAPGAELAHLGLLAIVLVLDVADD